MLLSRAVCPTVFDQYSYFSDWQLRRLFHAVLAITRRASLQQSRAMRVNFFYDATSKFHTNRKSPHPFDGLIRAIFEYDRQRTEVDGSRTQISAPSFAFAELANREYGLSFIAAHAFFWNATAARREHQHTQ
jgi:hypothetical protein